MKISRIDVYQFNIPLKRKVVVSIGTLSAAQNVVIRITTNTGLEGWGEASPFAPITGDTQTSNYQNAAIFSEKLMGEDPLAIENRMNEIGTISVGESSLRSAFNIALHDILAKTADLPLYRLLGGERRSMQTDFTISWQSTVAGTLDRLKTGIAAGFTEVKLKVGRPGLADVEHVAAVRKQAGPDMKIKIDSNQGWDYPTAVANLRAMEPYGLEYSEQPLPAWDTENLCRLRKRASIPICADESVFDDKDAFKLLNAGAVDYLNIKLGKSGGISTALRIESIARAAGCKCMIGCFAESRLGLTAAAHLACARSNITFLDLDSAFNLQTDPVDGGIIYDERNGGLLTLPEVPGLGASINEEFLRSCKSFSITG